MTKFQDLESLESTQFDHLAHLLTEFAQFIFDGTVEGVGTRSEILTPEAHWAAKAFCIQQDDWRTAHDKEEGAQ